MTKLVKCNYADKCSHKCAKHGYPHDKEELYGVYCTEWGRCAVDDKEIKVRCVGVKDKTCDTCKSQEDKHYCLLHSRFVKNMDINSCPDWEVKG